MEVIKENYKLYQGDCLELLKNIPNKSINLVLIDPPYNIGKDKWDKWDTVEDYVEFMGKVFLEIQRVLKDNGSFYFFHNDFMQIVELQNFINKNTDFIFRQLITWNKIHEDFKNYGYVQQRLSVDMMRNYYNGFTEYCLYYTFHDETGLSKVMTRDNFSKVSEKIREYVEGNFSRDYIVELFLKEGRYSTIGSARVHASYKMGWNKGKRFDLMDEKLFDYLNNYLHFPFKYEELRQEYEELRQEYEELRQKYEALRYTFNTATVKEDLRANSNVWLYPPAKKQGHITPKPVELLENIINHSTNKNDVVLDCFMGSGSTGVACLNTNRKFIGIELDENYFNIACDRLENPMYKQNQNKINDRQKTLF